VHGGQWVNCVATTCTGEALSMAKRQADLDRGVERMLALSGSANDVTFKVTRGVTRPVWEPNADTCQAARGVGALVGPFFGHRLSGPQHRRLFSAIGLALTLIHLISIPISNTSVNPARSTGVAFFNGNGAVGQLWLFWLAPIIGAAIAGATFHLITGVDRRDRDISGEIAARIDAAVRAGHLPAQDTALAATALLGALHESLVGPLAPENMDDPARLRDAVQTVTLLALRAVGVMDARARGLVVQAVLPAVLPAKALVGA